MEEIRPPRRLLEEGEEDEGFDDLEEMLDEEELDEDEEEEEEAEEIGAFVTRVDGGEDGGDEA